MIACDTSCLSEFFRRKKTSDGKIAFHVEDLIRSGRAVLFGVVRQELLSGIKHPEQFKKIEITTRAMPLFLADDDDHITAARFFNGCRANGVQGAPIDFLICAMAVRRKLAIYTTDPDFNLYEPHVPIQLHRP